MFDNLKSSSSSSGFENLGFLTQIHSLRCQVPFSFTINSEAMRNPDTNRVIKYVADFEYFTSEGERKVVDVKGFKTDVYKIKKALMLACNAILIEEV